MTLNCAGAKSSTPSATVVLTLDSPDQKPKSLSDFGQVIELKPLPTPAHKAVVSFKSVSFDTSKFRRITYIRERGQPLEAVQLVVSSKFAFVFAFCLVHFTDIAFSAMHIKAIGNQSVGPSNPHGPRKSLMRRSGDSGQ